jgi:hypothetical protein
MANPFGDKDESASKRPAQTIEGTATEVPIEPAPGEAAAAASSEAGRGEAADQAGAPADDAREPSAPPPRTRFAAVKSFMTHLAAGLLGGVVGVIALALAWGGFGAGKESAPSPDVTALEQRLANLEGTPASAPDTQAISGLEGRVKALEEGENAEAPKLSELSDRVDKLDTSLESLAKTAEEGGSVAEAAAIDQQIEDAEKRLDTKIDAVLAKAEAANASAIVETERAIAELRAKLGALAEAELGTGDADVSQPELAALTERIAKLETMLPELAGTIDKEAAGNKTAALAIAFANLRASVSDGRPYAAELDTIGVLAPALGDLGVLPAYAEKGIPTVPELTRSFDAARDEALAAAAPPADVSLVDSLLSSAESLVKIRRIDESPAGEGAQDALARAKSALDNGDLAVAVREIETLDGKPREAFSSWLGQARARLSAGETLTRLEGALLISLSGEAEATQP